MVGVIRVDLETLGGNTGGDSGSRVSRNNIRRGVGDFRYSGGGRAAVFTVLCSSENNSNTNFDAEFDNLFELYAKFDDTTRSYATAPIVTRSC